MEAEIDVGVPVGTPAGIAMGTPMGTPVGTPGGKVDSSVFSTSALVSARFTSTAGAGVSVAGVGSDAGALAIFSMTCPSKFSPPPFAVPGEGAS